MKSRQDFVFADDKLLTLKLPFCPELCKSLQDTVVTMLDLVAYTEQMILVNTKMESWRDSISERGKFVHCGEVDSFRRAKENVENFNSDVLSALQNYCPEKTCEWLFDPPFAGFYKKVFDITKAGSNPVRLNSVQNFISGPFVLANLERDVPDCCVDNLARADLMGLSHICFDRGCQVCSPSLLSAENSFLFKPSHVKNLLASRHNICTGICTDSDKGGSVQQFSRKIPGCFSLDKTIRDKGLRGRMLKPGWERLCLFKKFWSGLDPVFSSWVFFKQASILVPGFNRVGTNVTLKLADNEVALIVPETPPELRSNSWCLVPALFIGPSVVQIDICIFSSSKLTICPQDTAGLLLKFTKVKKGQQIQVPALMLSNEVSPIYIYLY